jgi:hypothetical protein
MAMNNTKTLICPICDNPTRVYMGNARKDGLCGKHADLLKAGEIKLNDNGLFVDIKNNKILNKDYKEEIKEVEVKEKETTTGIVKCIGCGTPTKNGHLFCIECYKKYKDKQLLVKITKCFEINILDESYEGVYKCKDGHIVKSKSEREIDNYLFDHNIPHAYEKVVSIDGDSKHDLHPDFCLPNYLGKGIDVYIEHWGFNSDNRDYYKSKKYKIAKYKELGLTIISTNESDMNDPEAALNRKLNNFEFGKINFDENK